MSRSAGGAGQPPGRRLSLSFGAGPTAPGFVQVGANTNFDPDKGSGWLGAVQLKERDRGVGSPEMRSLVASTSPATFRITLSPGTHKLSIKFFDYAFDDHVTTIEIDSVHEHIPEVTIGRHEVATLTIIFENSESAVDLRFTSPKNNWIVNSLTLERTNESAGVCLDVVPYPADLWDLPPETDRSARQLVDRWTLRQDIGRVDAVLDRGSVSYLKTIGSIIDHFKRWQNDDGAIIDPYRGEEVQYATPCFAYAASVLARHDDRTDLIGPASRAMNWASQALATRTAANGHEDFFPVPIALSLALLDGLVHRGTLDTWRQTLAGFDPMKTYRHAIGGTGRQGSNWNCKALVGEYLLHKLGVRENLDFVTVSLLAQGRLFNNEFGLYAEGPMVYDALPRAWLSLMVKAGYAGPAADELAEALERGALTSLLLQSPSGEAPCGGRSSHHQWADAAQCVIFEAYAHDFAKMGNMHLAGVFRRSAHQAHGSLTHWQRPSGDLHIVKNRADPADRHGYEVYSSHSQYNLLAATALGLAYQGSLSSPEIVEAPTPAETGDFALLLPPPFNKVVANCHGTHVIVSLSKEKQGTTGLLRVHFADQSDQVGPSDALVSDATHHLPRGPRVNQSTGCSWTDASDRWVSLADQSADDVHAEVTIEAEEPHVVRFNIAYRIANAPVDKIVEHYELRRDHVIVRYSCENRASPARSVAWPVLVSDGKIHSALSVAEDRIVVQRGASQTEYVVNGCETLSLSDEVYPHRNGWMRVARAIVSAASDPELTIRRRA